MLYSEYMAKIRLHVNPTKKEIVKFGRRYPGLDEAILAKLIADNIRLEIRRHEEYVFVVFHIPEYSERTKSIESVEINIFYDRESNDADIFAFHTVHIIRKYEKQILAIEHGSFSKFLERILDILLEDEARIIEHILEDTKAVKEEYTTSKDSVAIIRHLTNNLNNISALKLIYDNQDQLLTHAEEYIRNYEDSVISYKRSYISEELAFARDFCANLMNAINTKYQVRMTDILYAYTRYTFILFLAGAVFEVTYGFVHDPSPIKITFWFACLATLAGSLIMLKKF